MRGLQRNSPPLGHVLRSRPRRKEDGGGVGAWPVLDTGVKGGRWVVACVALVLLLLIPSSCGKKGAPFLPQKTINARVVNLKGTWQAGYIELTGHIQDPSGQEWAGTGSRIQYAVYPVAEPPCDGCPIEYQGFYTYGNESVREGRFFCKIPGALKGNLYYFEVQLLGAKGVLGPPSNRAKVVVE